MIQNQILERRIATLIAQTFAISVEKTLEDIKKFGIEKTVENLENQPKFEF
jgi:hypothetical protein